ncbi:MAG TPA: DUF4160 domain-containing protein [Bacteroidia bacterium]|jgi:hypothetical protein|nr:DUF4160 domain-containing protein [Bacteroidia bacterium]
MSPAIFQYKSIKIRIYSNEHKPIHVHAESGDFGLIVEFTMREGKVVKVDYKPWTGHKPFTPALMRDLKKLVDSFKEQMVDDFIDFVDYKKTIHKLIMISKID